jgi:hypothetical protein
MSTKMLASKQDPWPIARSDAASLRGSELRTEPEIKDKNPRLISDIDRAASKIGHRNVALNLTKLRVDLGIVAST